MRAIKTYDLNEILELDKYFRIALINKITGYKSAHLIGTKSSDGISNLAIFNSIVHVGANPPMLGFVMRPLSVQRDTYANIKETGKFTVNQVTRAIHQKAHHTSAKFDSGQSEFIACGLEEEYLEDFPIPFVKESRIKIGLSYQEEHLIQANNTIFIVGKMEKLIVDEEAVGMDGDVDLEKLDTVAIGGLDTYYSGTKIARYQYARPGEELKKMEE